MPKQGRDGTRGCSGQTSQKHPPGSAGLCSANFPSSVEFHLLIRKSTAGLGPGDIVVSAGLQSSAVPADRGTVPSVTWERAGGHSEPGTIVCCCPALDTGTGRVLFTAPRGEQLELPLA